MLLQAMDNTISITNYLACAAGVVLEGVEEKMY